MTTKISVLIRNVYYTVEASKCELDFINGYGSMCVNKNIPCVGLIKKEYQKQYKKIQTKNAGLKRRSFWFTN